MLQKITRKMREDEKGFTLIELMVVVLIIGILIAIALPTFLGARTRAQNRAAQSDLRNAIAAAKTAYTDDDTYVGACAVATAGCSATANIDAIEPSLTFAATGTASAGTTTPPFQTSVGVGSVVAGDNQKWGAARMSASGVCYFITDYAVKPAASSAGTFRNHADPGGAACTGTQALTYTTSDGSW